jgi:GTP cyclohydrolase I
LQISKEKDSTEVVSLRVEHKRRLVTAGQTMIQAVGEDLGREGLVRTPERFAKAFAELCSGYQQDPKAVVGEGLFAAEGQGLVAVKDTEFYSLCEHHMLPFWGKASVAYFPNQHILGLSKVPRLVDCFAKRLQVQERLTQEIADAIRTILKPRAVAVRIEAEHMCMKMRGVEKTHGSTVTEVIFGEEKLTERERDRLFAAISTS